MFLWKKNKPQPNSGQAAEDSACRFLQCQGLKLLERNYRIRGGELDIICKQGDTLVFVEVKQRQRNDYGGAAQALSTAQRQRLIKTAQHYLLAQGYNQHDTAIRFDVVLIQGHSNECEWLQNAFEE